MHSNVFTATNYFRHPQSVMLYTQFQNSDDIMQIAVTTIYNVGIKDLMAVLIVTVYICTVK